MNVEQQSELLRAITDCEHSITEARVTLGFDRSKPGNNALHQLTNRIEAALASPAAEPVQAPKGWEVECGVSEFDATAWAGVRNVESQCAQVFYRDHAPLMFAFLAALASPPATKEAKAGPACPECGDTGYVRDATGDGPWNCPRCGRRDDGLCRSCSSTGACTAGSECVACSNQSYGAHARAADMLTAYAELIKATGRYAEEHYLPEVEHVVEQLRARPEGAA